MPSQIEREDWETIQAIGFCRAYRQATTAYDTGKPTKEETDLLAQVDSWRNEEDGEHRRT